jgi:hypothetical protein
MPRMKHPLSGTEYIRQDDGTVLVQGRGVEGVFTRQGVWLTGERRSADPGLCSWVADGYTGGGVKGGDLYPRERTSY